MANTKQASGLATVQNLYLMQMELIGFLQGGIRSEGQAKEAKQCLRQFAVLLDEADPRYMGGEDVVATLQGIREEMSARLRVREARSRAAKQAAAKRTEKIKR
ncbi:MAG TPA: hypothetical protein VJB10_03490 [Candidatus Peribacteraceae bacterium]|nr:hypothetical protein [Candidatus Peribacteraceae bacterium]